MDSPSLTAPLPVPANAAFMTALAAPPGAKAEMPAPASAIARILLVEDDLPLARLLSLCLGAAHFAVDLAHDGEAAQQALDGRLPDLIILDLNLPKIDGATLLSSFRELHPSLPILVLTGRTRTEDKIQMLDNGADDYLQKPVSLAELQARVRALLRRRSIAPAPSTPPTRGLTINRDEYWVERDGRRIELTPREFAILEYMMQNPNRVISRATLMEEVWRTPFDPSTNIVDVYMKYLRDKIDSAAPTKLIRTVRGIGYALQCA